MFVFFFFSLFFFLLVFDTCRKRLAQWGEPVGLPFYRQNTLEEQDVDLYKYCPAVLQTLRERIERHIRNKDADCWASVRGELNRQMQFVEDTKAERLCRPGALLILARFQSSLKELGTLVGVHERIDAGVTDKTQLCNLITVKEGPRRPLMQCEQYGPLVVRLVSAFSPVQVKSVSLCTMDGAKHVTTMGLTHSLPVIDDSVTIEQASFSKSSKMTLAWVGVKVVLTHAGSPKMELEEMPISGPFIVISNQKQWDAAMGRIIHYLLFSEQSRVPRYRLCNELQRAYLLGIRESNLADPKRTLFPNDFDFILQQHGIGDTADKKQFSSLWKWFGPTVSCLRHDPVALEMWSKGFIVGFMAREAVEALLLREPPGTFVLRFSLQVGGNFAIAFTSPEGNAVGHYLIKRSDVNATVSLATFLLSKPFFLTILQLIPSFTQPSWHRVSKSKALKEWDTQAKKTSGSVKGYMETLNIPDCL